MERMDKRKFAYASRTIQWKGNILPIIEDYLKEVNREERTLFNGEVLKSLEDKKFIVVYDDSKWDMNTRIGGRYPTDNILVGMTHDGLDFLNDLRKRYTTAATVTPQVVNNFMTTGPNSPPGGVA